jgi:phage terminase small subunit
MTDKDTNEDETPKSGANNAFDGLTIKQRLFAEYYVSMLNGTRAAIKAGYSVNSASMQATENLRNPKIKAYIEKLFSAGKMGKEEVIGQLTALSRANIGDYLQVVNVLRNGVEVEEWRFNLVRAIKDSNTAMIKSIKRDKFGVVVEMYDKVKTLELIGKHNRLFADITIAGDKPDATADVLSDAQLAALASKTHRTTDAVDAFFAQDAEEDIDIVNPSVPADETNENNRTEDDELDNQN